MVGQLFKLLIIYSTLISLINCYDDWVYKTVRDAEEKEENIDQCGICRLLTESFEKGLHATNNNNNNMQENYEDSEVRLTEIQENVCLDLENGKNKCLRLAQENEDTIEDWWFNQRKKEDLFQYFCIRKMKLCCLPGHFGQRCKKCPGYPRNICNKNGKCDGEGTRLGDGSCICNEGSQGVECDECMFNFTKVDGVCQKCDLACKDGCTKLGKEGCNPGDCADGFKKGEDGYCEDINECEENKKICVEGQTCENTYGSYHCLACDKSCKNCFGLSADQCIECATGYVKEDRKCKPYKESKKSNRMETFKYLLYVLITILSCILMSKKPLVALIITVFLSVYIGLSEYANNMQLNSAMEAFEELFL